MQQTYPTPTFGTISAGSVTIGQATATVLAPDEEVALLMAQAALELDSKVRALEELADHYRGQRDAIDNYLTKVKDAGGWDYEVWLEEHGENLLPCRISVSTEEPDVEIGAAE